MLVSVLGENCTGFECTLVWNSPTPTSWHRTAHQRFCHFCLSPERIFFLPQWFQSLSCLAEWSQALSSWHLNWLKTLKGKGLAITGHNCWSSMALCLYSHPSCTRSKHHARLSRPRSKQTLWVEAEHSSSLSGSLCWQISVMYSLLLAPIITWHSSWISLHFSVMAQSIDSVGDTK